MSETWKQERPKWCPHIDCQFRRRAMDSMCCGQLPKPEPHDGDFNTHRLCLNGADKDGGVFDLQINKTDRYWLSWVTDIDEWKSSHSPICEHLLDHQGLCCCGKEGHHAD